MTYVGVIADDFTGASDIANTLAKGLRPGEGLRTIQYLGLPKGPAPEDIEACVISLKSRTSQASEAVGQSLAALDWLRAQGCQKYVFKYCSTFDSTSQGNIGPVASALAQRLGVSGVVVCPAFPATGRTVYKGHLFVGDSLLNETGMARHPLTPMTDANLPRWLGRQVAGEVGLVDLETVRASPSGLRQALGDMAARGRQLVVVDATSDDDLIAISLATEAAPLVTGSSGVALGIPGMAIRRGLAKGWRTSLSPVVGPAAILVGSCSQRSLAQIEHHKASGHPVLPLDVEDVMAGNVAVGELGSFVLANAGRAPLIASSLDPAQVARLQARFGREAIAGRLDGLFGSLARLLVQQGVRRLVVGGGETSGAVLSALDMGELEIGPEIDPGVPLLYSCGSASFGFALKSGNFGSDDFFSKAVAMLGGGRG